MTIPDYKTQLFVICIRNDDYPAALEVRKLYQVVPDTTTDQQFIRVIDESGEDYLYPADYFLWIDLPPAVEQVLRRAA